MRRVRAVLILELALLAVWLPFGWALLAPRRLFFQTPAPLALICQLSPYGMALNVIPGLLGLRALGGVDRERRKCRTYPLAALLCLLHAAAGGLLIGFWLTIEFVIVFLRLVF